MVFRFDYGGLENGVVNLINRLPEDSFRHCIVALTEATEFRERIEKKGVEVHCVGKQPGKDPAAYLRLYRLLRKLKPTIVHTRNLGTLECQFVAWCVGAPVRIHGEHGWDIYDPDGTNRKYRLLRRIMSRFVDRFVTVSEELATWLAAIGIPAAKITRICNGVDTDKFRPRETAGREPLPADVFSDDCVVVGSVTRFSPIKDPLNVINAFIQRQNGDACSGPGARLLMIGDGELHDEARKRLQDSALPKTAWLAGSRSDVPEMLRTMDVFVLGSLREGISNTILEAMASGLPVIATATGGNHELVADGVTGKLIPPSNPEALAEAIGDYVCDPEKRARHGNNAREAASSKFSLAGMIDNYNRLYSDALQRVGA